MVLLRVLILLVVLIFPHPSVPQQSAYDDLIKFYANEMNRYSEVLEKHILQLDKCLGEMNQFEKGQFLLEAVECPKFNRMKTKISSLLDELKAVMKSYANWLKDIANSNLPIDSFAKSYAAQSQVDTLLRIYLVKTKQAQIQTQRIQKLEKKLTKEFEGLSEMLKEFQQLEELKKQGKEHRSQ